MRISAFSLLASLFMMVCSLAQAQITTVDNTTSTPVVGVGHDYIQSLNETVNPANGSVSISVVAPTPHERAFNQSLYALLYSSDGQLFLSPTFTYSSSVGLDALDEVDIQRSPLLQTGGSAILPSCCNGAYGAPGSVTFQEASRTMSAGTSGGTVSCVFFTNFVYIDLAGGVHSLNLFYIPASDVGAPGCGSFGISGNTSSGGDELYHATVTAPGGNFQVTVSDNHGDQLTPGAEDTNGNYSNTANRAYSQSFSAYVPGQINALTVPGLGGSYAYTYPTEKAASSSISLSPTLVTSSGPCVSSFTSQFNVLSGNDVLTLPNKQQYTLQFDPVYGLVNKVVYPTGAWVSYTWALNPQSNSSVFHELGQTSSALCGYRYDWPAIQTRIVSYDGVHEALEQDFSYATTWSSNPGYSWATKTTTVTTKDLLQAGTPSYKTVYTYLPNTSYSQPLSVDNNVQADALPVEHTIAYYDTTGTLLRTVTKVWNTPNQLIAECITLPTGQTSGVFYAYVQGTTVITDKSVYDTGQIATVCQKPGATPTRETVTQYQSFAQTPMGTAILDRPLSDKVYDHGTLIKETDFTYTPNATVAVTPAASNHDEGRYGPGSTTSRGNPITVTQKCLQGCPDAVTTYSYDETGEISTVTDPNNNPATKYTYTDHYTSDDGSPSGNTNTYVTGIIEPTVNGVAHTRSFTYGYDDGKMRSSTDDNNATTHYCYYIGGCGGSTPDPWARLQEEDNPDGGSTKVNFNDDGPEPSTTVQVAINADVAEVTKSTFDAYGHTIESDVTSDPEGADTVTTTYNGSGLVASVSNPQRSSSGGTDGTSSANGVTTYEYDALGRTIWQDEPDGGIQSWCYDGLANSMVLGCVANLSSVAPQDTWVTHFDERHRQSQAVSDAFESLVAVMEPDPSSKSNALETDYKYDALNDLTRVDQWGGSANSAGDVFRTFSYDSLSRLITAYNPESGTVCYGQVQGDECVGGYDGNGNLLYKTNAMGQVTAYTYDALNRLSSKSYPNSDPNSAYKTPTACYQYDKSAVTGAGGNLIGRLTNEWTQSASAGACPASPPSSGVLTRRAILAYDALGRLSSEQQCTPTNCSVGTPYSVTHDYDLAGNPTMYTNGIGSITLTNAYDAGDYLLSVTSSWDDATHPSPLFSAPTYYAGGQLNTATYGTGLTLMRTYNNRLFQTGETGTGGIVVNPIAGSAALTITGAEQTR